MKKRLFCLLLAAMMMPFAMQAQSNAGVHIDSTISACVEYTWSVNGTNYTTSGVYTHVQGDTLYILDLTINPTYANTTPIAVAGGCTFEWGDTTILHNGVYTKSFESVYGCDSTVTINLTLGTSATRAYFDTVCGKLTWKGTDYTTSGVYTVNTTMASDPTSACDSNLTMNLVVIAPTQKAFYDTITGCERVRYRFQSGSPYIYFYANTDTTSDAYSYSTTSAENVFHPRTVTKCYDSTIYLNVTVNSNKFYNYQTSACDQFEFLVGDSTYIYSFSRLDSIKAPRAANGCDSTIVLNLTIHQSPVVTIVGDLRVAPNSNTTLYANCDQAQQVDYYWTYRNQHSTADSITLNSVTENEDVSLRATNRTSQCASTIYVTIMANASISNANESMINVYPNPTSARINISSEQEVKNVTLFNISGQQVMSTPNTDINLSTLNNGTYVVRVELQNGTVATRTIVLNK